MKKEIVKFIIVGCGNTIIGMSIIYILYNLCGCGYWMASGIGYAISSTVSYFINKCFTFQYKGKNHVTIVRFFANVALCYFVAYTLAKPLTLQFCNNFFSYLSYELKENIALFVGMCIYTGLNFVGQKWFCFRDSCKE